MNEIGHGRTPTGGCDRPKKRPVPPRRSARGTDLLTSIGDDRGQRRPRFVNGRQ
jgi:hypothetical protein